jgi:exopolysaccharide biosynthesis polyprenyl glycosylphosphotransferase
MKKKASFMYSGGAAVVTALALDCVFVVAADLASFILRYDGKFPATNFGAYLKIAPLILVLRIASFYVFGLYTGQKYKSNFYTFISVLKSSTMSSVLIIFGVYFMDIAKYPRGIVILSWLMTVIFISSWRLVLKEFVSIYLGKDFFRSCVAVIGTSKEAAETAMRFMKNNIRDYVFAGFIDVGSERYEHIGPSEVLGPIEEMESIAATHRLNEVILAESDLGPKRISELAILLGKNKISFHTAPFAYDTFVSNALLAENAFCPAEPVACLSPPAWYWSIKRLFDIFFAAGLLVLTLPLFIIIAITIKISSPGPILYLQKRIGRNGEIFVMYKFRTMCVNSESPGRPKWAVKKDARVFPAGRIMRIFRLDELPQLVNVLKNDMSLIGPRPERPYFSSKLMKKIPFYSERLLIKPGISGWAQVNLGYTDSDEGAREKLAYDIFYVQNMSFSLDFLILLKTFRVILTGHGAQ